MYIQFNRLIASLLFPALVVGFFAVTPEIQAGKKSKWKSVKAIEVPPPPPPPDTVTAAQIFQLPGDSPEATEAFIIKLKESGFDTLILRVFHTPWDRLHAGGTGKREEAGVYFETKLAPSKGDVLTPTAELCHKHGLKIFAWMVTREIPWDFPNKHNLYEYEYDFPTKEIVRGAGLDIFNPEVRAYLRALFRDLAKAPIDGVLLQDDLVLRHHVGFGPFASQVFQAHTGAILNPGLLYESVEWPSGPEGRPKVAYREPFWKWSRIKSEAIEMLFLELRRTIQDIRPGLPLAINTYYDSVLMPKNGLAWLSQDIEAWAKSPIEYFSVMAYHRQMAEEMKLSLDDSLLQLHGLRAQLLSWKIAPSRQIIKIQTRDWSSKEAISLEEIRNALNVFENTGTSLALVPIDEDWSGLASDLLISHEKMGTTEDISTKEEAPAGASKDVVEEESK